MAISRDHLRESGWSMLNFFVSADFAAPRSAPPILAAVSTPPSARRSNRKCGTRGGCKAKPVYGAPKTKRGPSAGAFKLALPIRSPRCSFRAARE